MEPNSREFYKQCAFQKFCNTVLHNEACDAHRELHRHKVGLSATVHRSDGMIEATYALLGHIAYTVPDEAVGDKIMKVGIKPWGTGVTIARQALNTDGTLNYSKLITYLTEDMTLCGYTSRNIPSPETFSNVVETRMRAKASGDKATANALKLVVNTTYGAMLNKYNDLYDPLMGRSVCITGQLFLLELARHLYQDIPDLKIVQLNTDGIMVECSESQLPAINEICDEWQARTGFELEEDSVVKIAQKDVNNYIEIQADGSSKEKGGYLVRGIAPAGAFNIIEAAVLELKLEQRKEAA